MNESKILLVEDDAVSAMLMKKRLGATATVLHCATPQEFMQTATDYDPDIILMDIELGADMTGFNLVEWYRQQHGTAQIIFISSYDTAEVLSRIYACGGNDYILKPPRLDVLETKILEALEWRVMDALQSGSK
ncbi:PleD family two-component system response regulator [Aquitalea sp. USM4]|uniref:response regulator n=1 Tax=Aquitalea sp. USM4 TaxID=1590041 RepID=UPI00103E31A5|nr:response regulator [Aquitalea sp. USM4]QBJ79563.1 hypothetical protein DKK66_16715 [Aquitalea sp. USM4]